MPLSRRFFLALLLAAAFPPAALLAGEAAAEKPVLLLTGFEPFGGLKVNASWETVKAFEGQELGGYRIATALLPVVYDEMTKPLYDAIAKHKPRAVISCGVGTAVVRIETLARNGYHPARPPDNKGVRPTRKEIEPNGPEALPTSLPAAEILAALKEAKIGAASSDDAGGYLCNECFYRLMALPRGENAPPLVRRGFVHVPDFGTPDPAGGTFTPEKLQAALKIVIEQTVRAADGK
ncbi:MAG: pyroglutamyl-peptidase I [Planctomycetota bacterium]|nr:pyroglutamyl-peptidase I [Planctomycetota bacterium]